MCESGEHLSVGDGPILALGIRDVIADQYPEFSWEYPCGGDPLPCWFLVRVTRFRGAGPIRVVVAHEDISERKRAEEARRLTEAKYRGIFENAVEGIYQTTVDGRFLTANPMLARIYGFSSPEELVTETSVPRNHFYVEPGRREQFMRLVVEHQALTGFESQIRRQDGSLVWISENARVVLSSKGDVIGYEGTVVDISDRKRAEETLHEANDTLRAIIQASPLAIFTLDREGIIRSWNAAAERMFGWAEAEVKHRPTPLLPADRINEFHELMGRLMQGEAFVGFQSRRLRKDGSLIDASISAAPLYDATGRVNGVMTVMADVTDVKKAEGALLEERALLRGLIDSIPDHIFYKDRNGNYLGCNAAFEQYAGQSEKEIVGQTFMQLFPKREAGIHEAIDRQVVEDGKPHRLEEWVEYPDGRRTLAEVVKTPFLGPDGQIRGLIGMSRDITERKRLEEGLRQAQKMEAVGQLAGGVAHDFNNLLTAILGNVSLLLQNSPDGPDRELLRDTERAASRAADLTGQLLGFSRKTLLRLEPCNLNTSIDEIVGILRRTIDPRITVEVQTTPGLAPVLADPGQMNQVLMNLCLNARDAMPEGGRLVLETANIEIDPAHARRHVDARPGQFVRLRVRDTGHGIPPDIRPRIFDPFFTTKGPGKGTGLGLAMVFGIVQQHQGWVECQSEPGRGTDFEIYLPRSLQAPAPQPAPTTSVPVGGHETILLVDDEAVIRNLGRTVLQRHGYRVMLAEDGQEAVGVYRREHPGIDLVILDLTMPRLSGRDTLRQLRQFDPEVRVLFSSGYSAEQIPEPGKEGVLGFVNKPYRPQDLVREVRQALDQGRTNPAAVPVA
jgi:PAS domain S-box-containing protein